MDRSLGLSTRPAESGLSGVYQEQRTRWESLSPGRQRSGSSQMAGLKPRTPQSQRADPAAPLPHPPPGLGDTRGSHTRERPWAELRQWRGKPTLSALQQGPRRDRTHPRDRVAPRCAASGVDPFPAPQKGPRGLILQKSRGRTSPFLDRSAPAERCKAHPVSTQCC